MAHIQPMVTISMAEYKELKRKSQIKVLPEENPCFIVEKKLEASLELLRVYQEYAGQIVMQISRQGGSHLFTKTILDQLNDHFSVNGYLEYRRDLDSAQLIIEIKKP